MTVGEKIKYFRTMHGFTQEQLVQATGLSISTLQKYESDERKPKPEQLLKISQALGISINIFMDFDIHTVSDLLSLIFKMNEQLDLNFDSQKDTNGNIIPDTLTLSFKNPIINQKLSTYVSFLNKMTGSEREQYTQINIHNLLWILRTNYLMTIQKFTRLLLRVIPLITYRIPLFQIRLIRKYKTCYLIAHRKKWNGS